MNRKTLLSIESLETRRTLSSLARPTHMETPPRACRATTVITNRTPTVKAQQAPLSKLSQINIGGDQNKRITATISVPNGTLYYTGSDRSIQVSATTNSTGGKTLTLTGTAASINNNLPKVMYWGFQPKALVQIGINGRVCASSNINFRRA
jgi:hypothetical protein